MIVNGAIECVPLYSFPANRRYQARVNSIRGIINIGFPSNQDWRRRSPGTILPSKASHLINSALCPIFYLLYFTSKFCTTTLYYVILVVEFSSLRANSRWTTLPLSPNNPINTTKSIKLSLVGHIWGDSHGWHTNKVMPYLVWWWW